MARWKYKVYHVVPNSSRRGGWRVQGENSQRPSSWHDNKEQAVERGKELAKARKGQVIVHKADGEFQTEYTYGHDPSSSPG